MRDAKSSARTRDEFVPMIRCLVPDLPSATELLPWLAQIDENRWYTNFGPLLREFEQRVGQLVAGGGGAACISLSSGMSALELGLDALRIGSGKRVLMPALTFPATALAVVRCGAEPVLADVCPRTWTLTPEIAREAAARERIDLVMPVAAFGLALPHAEWDDFVADTGIAVFADAAAALGAQAIGRRVHWAFSLHATKPLGIGEGGLFVSPDGGIATTVRRLSNFGFAGGVVGVERGTNAKLSEYAAAVGLAQLQRWPQINERRLAVLQDYRRLLAPIRGLGMQSGLEAPPATLCVQLPVGALDVASGLAQRDIETRRWYLPALDEHPALRGLRRIETGAGANLPVTRMLSERLLGLPFHGRLSTADVAFIAQSLDVEVQNEREAPSARRG